MDDAWAEAPEEDCTYLAVVEKQKAFTYVVPSFPVYEAELQEVKFQYTNSPPIPKVTHKCLMVSRENVT